MDANSANLSKRIAKAMASLNHRPVMMDAGLSAPYMHHLSATLEAFKKLEMDEPQLDFKIEIERIRSLM